MSLLDRLNCHEVWEAYYVYKADHHSNPFKLRRLRRFIDNMEYREVYESILAGDPFPLPRRCVISKLSTGKKRIIYIFPEKENFCLKLLTYLMLRTYDSVFESNLYSFRPNHGAKEALKNITRHRGLNQMYVYKADISNYFNSVNVSLLLPMLQEVLGEDPRLLSFLSDLLLETGVWSEGEIIEEQKGIMAGTPVACFFANLYLREMDRIFAQQGVLYARYSDDIILFAADAGSREGYISQLKQLLNDLDLTMNPKKEELSDPGQSWVFLGFQYKDQRLDVAPASVIKMKKKMRRKTRALKRWQERKKLPGIYGARAFIKTFNRKFFEQQGDGDLTWCYWFFPVITSTEGLKIIDHYAQECIRFLISGKRTKARYGVRYEDMKALGYKNLVHEYYEFLKECREQMEEKENGK